MSRVTVLLKSRFAPAAAGPVGPQRGEFMRQRKWMLLCSLLLGALPGLGACGVTELQLRDFVITTGSRAVVTTAVNILQAVILQSQGQ